MPSLFSLKENIIKETQAYYDAKSTNDKSKHKGNLQKQLKKFHFYRKTHKKDYESIKKVIENIT